MADFGTAGLEMDRVRKAIATVKAELLPGMPYGMNPLCNLGEPWIEEPMPLRRDMTWKGASFIPRPPSWSWRGTAWRNSAVPRWKRDCA